MEQKTIINEAAKQLGRRGGLKTLENKGKDHYKAMAKAKWDKHQSSVNKRS